MKYTAIAVAVLALVLTPMSFGQLQVSALDFAQWTSVVQADAASGSVTVTVAPCVFTSASGLSFNPFSTSTPITFQDGASLETVTPSAVGAITPASNVPGGQQCTLTLSNTFAHKKLVKVTSGDGGVSEAAVKQKGGFIRLVPGWGSDTAIASIPVTAFNVVLVDETATAPRYYSIMPSTLTALATPATRSAVADATQVISGTATGTWPNSAEFVCVTYVDRMGGESPCSATFNFTATLNKALNFAAPAASTGAVGWRAYAGITSLSTAYQLPISSTTCVLSSLTPYPTCAMGAAGVFPTPTTTTALAPGYVVNVYRPNPQSHTTFGYQAQSNAPKFLCGNVQSDFGPFIASSGGTTGQVEVLGTVPLPSGCLNSIFKTIRVSGKITMTAGASETPVLKVMLGPSFTTGTPTAICSLSHTTALSAAVYNAKFSCTITTNAIGASGTLMPDGELLVQLGAGTTIGNMAVDTGTAAITNKLDTVNNIYVVYTPTSGTNTAAQLVSLHVEEI